MGFSIGSMFGRPSWILGSLVFATQVINAPVDKNVYAAYAGTIFCYAGGGGYSLASLEFHIRINLRIVRVALAIDRQFIGNRFQFRAQSQQMPQPVHIAARRYKIKNVLRIATD